MCTILKNENAKRTQNVLILIFGFELDTNNFPIFIHGTCIVFEELQTSVGDLTLTNAVLLATGSSVTVKQIYLPLSISRKIC
jgi:hypothetical protein